MRRQQTQSIDAAILDFLRDSGLEKNLLQRRVVELWPTIMGDMVARLTRSVDIDKGVLIVKLSSAALKAQLFDMRFDLVRKMNTAVGAEVIRDVRLY